MYQKRDPIAIKELSVVVLARIYMLTHKYQTLIREVVTPTLPAFTTACLQNLKPVSTSKAAVITPPMSFTETVLEAFSMLISLYPTTLRPYISQIRSVVRPYLAPTSSDDVLVPQTLQDSSRRLATRLHIAAAKNGGADEWAKHFGGLIREIHETADQVFRGILENWEPSTGYTRQPVDFGAEPSGGSTSTERLPQWVGIQAGSERMTGLLGCLTECLRCATKVAVTIPISTVMDFITRVSLIIPPVPGKDKNEYAQMNAAIGREEKDDLWAVFPDIQVATLQLTHAMVRRLGKNFTPLAQETLDQVVRIVDTGYRLPEVRSIAFALTIELLQLNGPTMPKAQVDALQLVSMTCCRDLLGAAGHLKVPKQQTSMAQNGTKSSATQNADAFLKSNAEDEYISVALDTEHLSSAKHLLTALFNHLPQQHIVPNLRFRMLRTAILCQLKDAQVASILNPAKDRNGRTAQVILPYLHQQFPHDEAVEILRFNFRPVTTGPKADMLDTDDEMEVEPEKPVEKSVDEFTYDRPFQISSAPPTTQADAELTTVKSAPLPPGIVAEELPSPFLPQPVVVTAAEAEADVTPPAASTVSTNIIPLKRKNEEDGKAVTTSKRVDIAVVTPDPGFGAMGTLVEDTLAKVAVPATVIQPDAGVKGEDSESDDESVHLNMDLDSDVDEEE
jgi:pre-rRNA-processing protein RIX1